MYNKNIRMTNIILQNLQIIFIFYLLIYKKF